MFFIPWVGTVAGLAISQPQFKTEYSDAARSGMLGSEPYKLGLWDESMVAGKAYCIRVEPFEVWGVVRVSM